jgi:hypothetical protein
MGDKMPNCFLWFQIFLATNLAEPALHFSFTIKTVFFLSFLIM